MLSWLKSTVYPSSETPVAPAPKKRYLVDEEFLDTALKLVNEQHEMLKAVYGEQVARAETLAKLQGCLTDAQKKLIGETRSKELQKEIDINNEALKREFGVKHYDIPSNDLPLPHILGSKIIFTIDEEKTIEIDVSAAKKFYALSMTHDGTTEQVDDICCLQVKATEGEFSFGFPMISEGMTQAMAWFKELKTLLSQAELKLETPV